MKKQVKSMIALICSFAMIGSMLMGTASAMPKNIISANFDSGVINFTPNSSNTKFNDDLLGKSLRLAGLNTTYGRDAVSYVQDPASTAQGDRALRLTLNSDVQSDTLQLYSYVDNAEFKGAKMVYQYNIMFDAKVNNYMYLIQQDGSNKELRLLQFYADGDNISVKNYVGGNKLLTLKYNEWYNIQTVVDYSQTLNGDGTYDYTKAKLHLYINGVEYITDETGDLFEKRSWTSTGLPKLAKLVINTSDKSYPERHIYLDDWMVYKVDTDSETEVVMPNYTGKSFIYGNSVRLQADAYIGDDNDLAPINKVVYRDNGEEIATCTLAPFDYCYKPEGVGLHTITAEAYSILDSDFPLTEASTSVFIEPTYRENYLMYEDFENYSDGVTSWDDGISGSWAILGAAGENAPKVVNIDPQHSKSLDIGLDSGRNIRANTKNISGTIKISGEYYFETTGNNNNIMILANASGAPNSMRVHGAMDLLDCQNSNTVIDKLTTGKWYKIDLITTIKEGQGYYTIFVDGQRVAQNAYQNANYTSIASLDRVEFLSSFNTSAKVYVDNLSISQIEYYDNTGFWANGKQIESLSTLSGNVLSVKSYAGTPAETTQTVAVYDKETDVLVDVVIGDYNELTQTFTADVNIDDPTKVYVKAFLWNEMMPLGECQTLQ